jgi:hypothetical protein
VNTYSYRKLGLDETLLTHSYVVLTKALQAGKQLTREELATVLQKNGFVQKGLGLAYISTSSNVATISFIYLLCIRSLAELRENQDYLVYQT